MACSACKNRRSVRVVVRPSKPGNSAGDNTATTTTRGLTVGDRLRYSGRTR